MLLNGSNLMCSASEIKKKNLNVNDLAPISVTVYTRLGHFRQCIESLVENPLAKDSILYVFSDAAKQGDEEDVRKVREYAENIIGFHEVILIFQEKNDFIKNMRDAREIPANKYGKVIRLEDDVVTASGFLTFVNHALQFYEYDDTIINVTGYCPPVLSGIQDNDFFVLPRTSAWGIGYYSKLLDVINTRITKEAFNKVVDKRVLSIVGTDVPRMIKKEISGKLTAGDVR